MCEGEVASRCGAWVSGAGRSPGFRAQSAPAGAAGTSERDIPRPPKPGYPHFRAGARTAALTPRTPMSRPVPSLPFASPVPPSWQSKSGVRGRAPVSAGPAMRGDRRAPGTDARPRRASPLPTS